jgi:hypothetical protein
MATTEEKIQQQAGTPANGRREDHDAIPPRNGNGEEAIDIRTGYISIQQDRRYDYIDGWGIDADLRNDPTYPMKNRTNEEHAGNTWERPTLQEKHIEILSSNERNNLPAVFGTTLPPSGVSGVLRRFAFRYSESDYRHWLPLMLADRINVMEGRIKDIAHGDFPNIIAERGLKAEWKYNKKACITKAAATAVVASAAVAWFMVRKSRKKQAQGGIIGAAADVWRGMSSDMSKVS